MSKVRHHQNEIQQKLTIPFESGRSVQRKCEEMLTTKLKDTPTKWGVMMSPSLMKVTLPEFVTPIHYGTSNFLSITVDVEYESVGYRNGDVLFNVGLADTVAETSPFTQFRKVSLVGLPFSINVKTRSEVPAMNIIIEDSRMEGTLCYFAKPAFYPKYGPIIASLCSDEITDEAFYASDSIVPSSRTEIEKLLLDPISKVPIARRNTRIMRDIRLMLNIDSTRPTPKFGGTEGMYEGKPKAVKLFASPDSPIIAEVLHLDTIEDKIKVLKEHKVPYHEFIRPPSLPLPESKGKFVPLVVCISWIEGALDGHKPTTAQLEVFKRAVMEYIHIKESEASSFREIYPKGILANTQKNNSPEAMLLREHLAAGGAILSPIKEVEEKKPSKVSPPVSLQPFDLPSTTPPSSSRKGRGRGGGG